MTATPFVPLEVPPWLRWGQRKGAFIDIDAFAAAFPDLRRYVQLEEAGPDGNFWKYVGTVRRCGWCAGECRGRRTAWCSQTCSEKFYRVWNWGAVANYVLHRDGGTCQRCGRVVAEIPQEWRPRRLIAYEIDHIVPVVDGGTDDPANLRTLCRKPCHLEAGREQRRARREKVAPELPLEFAT